MRPLLSSRSSSPTRTPGVPLLPRPRRRALHRGREVNRALRRRPVRRLRRVLLEAVAALDLPVPEDEAALRAPDRDRAVNVDPALTELRRPLDDRARLLPRPRRAGRLLRRPDAAVLVVVIDRAEVRLHAPEAVLTRRRLPAPVPLEVREVKAR